MSLLTHSVTPKSDRSRSASSSFLASFAAKCGLLPLLVAATLGGAGCSAESAPGSSEATGTVRQALSSVPSRVQAESYDRANESTPATNSGNACNRGDGVDMETTTDNNGVCNVGWTTAGEWLEYDLSVPTGTSNTFNVVSRVASGTGNHPFHLTLNGVTIGSFTTPNSGWQTFADRTAPAVTIPTGQSTLRIIFDEGDINLNYIDVLQVAAGCGNGVVQSGEQCDDGNTVSGDGCSSTCQTETSSVPANTLKNTASGRYAYVVGTTVQHTTNTSLLTGAGQWTFTAVPGDANGAKWIVNTGNGCRMHIENLTGAIQCTTGTADAWMSSRWLETTVGTHKVYKNKWQSKNMYLDTALTNVTYGTVADTDTRAQWDYNTTSGPVCGNGIKEGTEGCDDGNTVNGDGCSSTCTVEAPVCGNRIVQTGEQCDDGNTVNGDGCSSTCQVEAPVCGNRIVQTGEQCDDGNTVNGDGCSSTCQLEIVCGNGVVQTGEQCDDGNTVSGDGCSSTCQTEVGNVPTNTLKNTASGRYAYVVGTTVQHTTTTSLLPGAGQWTFTAVPGDTQGAKWIINTGNGCKMHVENLTGAIQCTTGTPDNWMSNRWVETTVGTHKVYKNEWQNLNMYLDTAVTNVTYGNVSDTRAQWDYNTSNGGPACGNGVKEGTEACDDGNLTNGDGCSSTCTIEQVVCGNGILQTGEQCDDGNTVSGDGCSSTCQTEAPVCGNGIVQTGEQCDDHNTVSGDGCSSTCQIESTVPANTLQNTASGRYAYVVGTTVQHTTNTSLLTGAGQWTFTAVPGDTQGAKWIVNTGNGCRMHIENLTGAIQCTTGTPDNWMSNRWVETTVGTHKVYKNEWQNLNMYLDTAVTNVTYGNVTDTRAQWDYNTSGGGTSGGCTAGPAPTSPITTNVIATGYTKIAAITPDPVLDAQGKTTALYVLEKGHYDGGTNNGPVPGRLYRQPLNGGAKQLLGTWNDNEVATLGWEMGMTDVVFHPQFGKGVGKDFVYIGRILTGLVLRVSRYTLNADGTINMNSEFKMFELQKEHNEHAGGGMAFGPDGKLYLGVGDDSANDPANKRSLRAQNDTQPFGKVIKMDPNATSPLPAWTIAAKGLRNPWRISFDGNKLWIGNVGLDQFEELNNFDSTQAGVINFGWPYCEGTVCCWRNGGADPLCQPNPGDGTPETTQISPFVRSAMTDPEYAYPQSIGQAGAAVIGGFSYLGNSFPQLAGNFIYADHRDDNVLAYNPSTHVATEILAGANDVSDLAEDASHEIYIAEFSDGRIRKLVAGGASPNWPPQNLADWGCFDSASITAGNPLPKAGVIPYGVAQRFWSDGADKSRFISVPTGTKLDVTDPFDWMIPVGAVAIKNFRWNGKIFETRLYVRHSTDTYAGYSYRWSDAANSATLVPVGGENGRDLGGLIWNYPSRSGCDQCHTQTAGRVLGLETRQQNTTYDYGGGVVENQLTHLFNAGILSAAPTPQAPYPAIDDTTVSVPQRTKAYLHVNCSSCHRGSQSAAGRASWDARYSTLWQDKALCNKTPVAYYFDNGPALGEKVLVPGNANLSNMYERMSQRQKIPMPPLGSSLPDSAGATLLQTYINQLTACPTE